MIDPEHTKNIKGPEVVYDGPVDGYHQIEIDEAFEPDDLERQKWQQATERLHNVILELLKVNGIEVVSSSFRLKSRESIMQKWKRTDPSTAPLADIYGVRYILKDEETIDRAVLVIKKYYPTPDIFPWDMPTLRRGVYKEESSHPDYNTTRMNILFSEERKIAEIHLLTPEQEKIDKKTRDYYEEHIGKK